MKHLSLALPFLLATAALHAEPEANVAVGDEVDVTSGAVTGLSCAIAALETGNMALLTSCPLEEAMKEIVVVDVAEKQIYRITQKKVRRSQLEKAYGGGRMDVTGVVKGIKGGVASIDVEEFTITPKPKAGAFKGCL